MKKFIENILWVTALLVVLSSCSATWHLKRAEQKDPSLFEVQPNDTVTTVTKPVATLIDCDSIQTEPSVIFLPIEGTDDSVRIEYKTVYRDRETQVEVERPLTGADSLNIQKALEVTVDCPDQETIYIDRPVQVLVKPSLWDRLEYLVYSLIILLIIAGFYYGFVKRK